jgi:hypothetical protein
MKIVFLFLLSTSCLHAFAQTDSRIFYSQLMVVFSDLDKNFDFLKGELEGKEGETTWFETNLKLEGTKENSIVVSANSCSYHAMINDSTSEEGAQFVLKAWKEKLTNALNGTFTELEKEFRSEKDPGTNGYQYSSATILVLLLRHKAGDGSCWIDLVIKKN